MSLIQLVRANLSTALYTLLLGLVAIVVSSAATYYAVVYETTIAAFSTGEWVAFFVLSCFTMAFALTPTTFIALLSGYFLGWAAIVPVVMANWMASWIGYRAAQLLDGGRFLQNLTRKEKVRRVVENLQRNEFGVVIFTRLSPVLPFAITNVLLSLAGASLGTFLKAGILGMLPRIILSVGAGSQARRIRTLFEGGHNSVLQIGVTALVTLSLVGMYYYLKKAIRKSEEKV